MKDRIRGYIDLEDRIKGGVLVNPAYARIDKDKFNSELKIRKLSKKDLWKIAKFYYGMHIEYKTFMGVINGVSPWKLEHALIVSDILKIPVHELFILKLGIWKK